MNCLSYRPLLSIVLMLGLLLAGCAEVAPPIDATPEAPSPVPVEATVPPTAAVPGTAAPGPEPTTPPSSPTAPPALAARDALTGRLLFVRKGNVFLLSDQTPRRLTTTGDLLWPRWSPDGQRIAAVRRGDAFSELHLINPEGQNLSQLTRHQSRATLGSKEYVETSIWAVTPSWDPNGNRLVYAADMRTTNTTLYLIDARNPAPTTPANPQAMAAVSDLSANLESPVFAPDGKSLLFCLSFDTPTQLWSLNLASGIKTQLTDGKQTVYDPAWSPDGQAVAAAVIDGPTSSLWLLSPDGKQRRQLLRRPAARAPTWSPDGTQLAFVGEENGQFNIYLIDLARDSSGAIQASEPRRLTTDGDVDAVSGLSWSR